MNEWSLLSSRLYSEEMQQKSEITGRMLRDSHVPVNSEQSEFGVLNCDGRHQTDRTTQVKTAHKW